MSSDFYDLTRGDTLSPIPLRVRPGEASAYLNATGESREHWADTIPPLIPGVFVLAVMMEQISLPPGALHTGQEFEFLRATQPDEPLEVQIRVAQHSERQGNVILTLTFELHPPGSPADQVLRGRSTVIAPARNTTAVS
jgi:hypothetical protein